MKKTYTLTQLVESIKSMIDQAYGQKAYWVSCELVKVNIKGGHYYLELADAADGLHTAQMKATIWRTQAMALQTNFGNEFKALIQAGNRLLFRVSLTFHEIYGLSLNIIDLDPAFTYGEIELKKKQTIEKLQKEGLFELQKQIKLPLILKRIVLVGSPDSAGYRDFLSEMKSNPIFTNFTIKEIATSVQGDKAVGEICAALTEADSYNADAIVLIRGGGSKMDLNVFNDYTLCKVISTLRLPLITGIGHQTDEVVADLVANTSQITPTAVAKFLFVKVGTFRADLKAGLDRVLTQVLTQLATATDKFNNANLLLTHYFQTILNNYRATLELHFSTCVSAALNKIQLSKTLEIPNKWEHVTINVKNQIEIQMLRLTAINEKIELLNPIKLLRAGYTISSVDNIDLNNFKGDLQGKEMITKTENLKIFSTITKIQEA